MRLFLAEKMSMAQAIAEAVADMSGLRMAKENGYFVVGADRFTWLNGHMFNSAQPEEYDRAYKEWRPEHLPIIPTEWKLVPSKEKVDQLRVIESLFKRADVLVHCGDAGREGQLLVDELILQLGGNPWGSDVLRLWMTSYARREVIAAVENMEPNSARIFLYQSALCRQRMDWLFGINLTRHFTLLAQKAGFSGNLSVGRVLSPTLKLVVERDRQIKDFDAVEHFVPVIEGDLGGQPFKAEWIRPQPEEGEPPLEGFDVKGRLLDSSIAASVLSDIEGQQAIIVDVQEVEESEPPPLGYSLSTLQIACADSPILDLTAAETLKVAQELYELRLLTYPRTSSQHLPTAIYEDEAATILEKLAAVGFEEIVARADPGIVSRIWADAKVTDHHAIIPTTEITPEAVEALSDTERAVFRKVALRFLLNFFPDNLSKSVKVVIEVGPHRFLHSEKLVIEPGWKLDEVGDDLTISFGAGDIVQIEQASVAKRKTTPPDKFTDGTLIGAMSNIRPYVMNKKVLARLKEESCYGLGTEATKAPTIEKLIDLGYIKRVKAKTRKHLVATDIGKDVVAIIDGFNPMICDPGLTGLWEAKLLEIADGKGEPEDFMTKGRGFLTQIIDTSSPSEKFDRITLSAASVHLVGDGTPCPVCGEGRLRTKSTKDGRRFLGCDRYREGCSHVQWPEVEVRPLAGHGEDCPSCGEGKKVTKSVFKGDNKGKRLLTCSGNCGWKEYPEAGGWKSTGGRNAA